MVTEIRIHFEGDKLLRSGFKDFFRELRKRANSRRCRFELIECRDGASACKDFERALRSHPKAWNILLKDSEEPDTGKLSESLCQAQGWNKSHKNSIFWMVQMMEAWFHADREALKDFYGPDFSTKALKKNPKVEQISKADLEKGLSSATKNTSKGDYFDNKTAHGPKLLSAISPEKVRKAAPNCNRLFVTVLGKLEAFD